jgi:hypothetical protein
MSSDINDCRVTVSMWLTDSQDFREFLYFSHFPKILPQIVILVAVYHSPNTDKVINYRILKRICHIIGLGERWSA